VILDGVVCAPWKELGDVRPLVAILLVSFQDDVILMLSPRRLADLWVQMIVPSLTAIFPNPPCQQSCALGPLCGTILHHMLCHDIVFLVCPWFLGHF